VLPFDHVKGLGKWLVPVYHYRLRPTSVCRRKPRPAQCPKTGRTRHLCETKRCKAAVSIRRINPSSPYLPPKNASSHSGQHPMFRYLQPSSCRSIQPTESKLSCLSSAFALQHGTKKACKHISIFFIQRPYAITDDWASAYQRRSNSLLYHSTCWHP
jgi:hypothetical protein